MYETMFQLTPLDAKILKIIQRDASISHVELGEKVGASAASCWRRIKALETSGILGPTIRLVDGASIGRELDVICQVRMKMHDVKARGDFEAFVERQDRIMECYSMSGERDYQLRVIAAGMRDYEEFLMRELLGHPAVATTASHFALKRIKYSTAVPV